jgi:hypothetical protein
VLLGRRVERGRKIIGSANVMDLQRHTQRRRRLLQSLHLQRRDRVGEVGQHEHTRDSRDGFLQQTQTLGRNLGNHQRQAGDVPAGMGKAVDEAGPHGIAKPDDDDRNGVPATGLWWISCVSRTA